MFWRALMASSTVEEAARRNALEQQEREFHEFVRQQIICLIIFISLYLLSYWIISSFKSKSESDSLYAGDEDYIVYRVSVWICSVSLAISVGSIALLPFSIFSSELLHCCPNNYYLQWMSWSLINNLWNYVFALSNLSLFVLLPFSYFFIESQGFKKNKNGIMQRVYETLAVCTLLIVVILCLADIVLALMSSSVSIISITSVNLLLVYSFVSLAGVMLLLLSTPIGFAKMFAIAGEMTVVPDRDDIIINRLEKYYEERTRNANSNMTSNKFWQRNCDPPTFYSPVLHRFSTLRQRPQKIFPAGMNGSGDCDNVCYMLSSSSSISSTPTYRYFPESAECCSTYGNGDCHFLDNQTESNGPFSDMTKWNHVYSQSLFTLYTKTFRLFWQCFRLIKYPASVIILLVLTGISLLMVIINSLKLIFGYRSLPVYAQYMEVHTRHSLGLVGVVVESIIIIYVMATSLIGFYCIPFVRALRPRRAHTSLTVIIINCSLVLILSSALPILANTLGITSFDLLGAYSSLNWLNNFKLVLAYNILFASTTIVCVFSQITSPVRKQILRRLYQLHSRNGR